MNRGLFFVALSMGSHEVDSLARAERLFATMQQEPGVRLPGAERYRARALAKKEGVTVSSKLYAECFGDVHV